MAVAWTTITNGQVAAGAALTTALVTALRDNPEGIAQRASGAPKIFGTAYDYQEFTASGTWTKPSNAEAGDFAIVQVVGGGGAGHRGNGSGNSGGGGGGTGYMMKVPLSDLAATVAVVVGAGGVATVSNGGNGGASSFGGATDRHAISCPGGLGATSNVGAAGGGSPVYGSSTYTRSTIAAELTAYEYFAGGNGSNGGALTVASAGGGSIFGGGGGAGGVNDNADTDVACGGASVYAGQGGYGTNDDTVTGWEDGVFPGGGGGGVDSTSGRAVGGEGADGVVRVWCVKEG